ncbi:MAG: UvrD-helicase domain-containing protein [Myxococcales bacterium]|nr:UvrD-helicase domain-containing protein [Myxococcales bacterium]
MSFEASLARLNPVQQRAVAHQGTPLLLLAGAGSGKTRVVTHRIARLIRDGARPWQILAVTFTNRAAKEMGERVEALLGQGGDGEPLLCTFHALGARILREFGTFFGRGRDFVIYDTDDQLKVVEAAAQDEGLVWGRPQLKAVRRAIDEARNRGQDASGMDLGLEFGGVDTVRLGKRYEARLERANAFDFGDLILRPMQLLDQVPEVAERLRARWPHVLVDEFQDTNEAQFKLLQRLAPPGSDLFAVGDDDQSIYGWRGAQVGNILAFDQAWPTAQVVRLEQNYRSLGRILEAANGVIAHNTERLGKTLWTDREPGPPVQLHVAQDGADEARFVARTVAALGAQGIAPGDVGVLFRANHLSLDVEQALGRERLPYVVVRGRSFYERAEVRDAVAYLRLLLNPSDDVAFQRVVNLPPRGVGKASLDRLVGFAAAQDLPLMAAVAPALQARVVKGRAKAGLEQFQGLFQADPQASVLDQAGQLLTDAGFLGQLAEEAALGEDERARFENVQRLLAALDEAIQARPHEGLAGFLEQVKLVSDADAADPQGGRVSLMTVHAAKGLEFKVVFVIGMEEGLFPHARSISPAEVQEERRLAYVAITRAEERLYLTRARQRRGFRETRAARPSRFLDELPEGVAEGRRERPSSWRAGAPAWAPAPRRERPPPPGPSVDDLCTDITYDDTGSDALGWRPGMRVLHAQFGVGVVKAWRPGPRPILTVLFADVGLRKVLPRFVSLYEG